LVNNILHELGGLWTRVLVLIVFIRTKKRAVLYNFSTIFFRRMGIDSI